MATVLPFVGWYVTVRKAGLLAGGMILAWFSDSDSVLWRCCLGIRLEDPCHFKLEGLIFGWLLQVTVCPMLRDRCPVCNVGVLWSDGWIDQDTSWYRGRPRPKWHCLWWGPSSPSTERGTAAPHFCGPLYSGMVTHLSNCWSFVEQMMEENQGSNQITAVRLQNGHEIDICFCVCAVDLCVLALFC